jgi:hypothetical protein
MPTERKECTRFDYSSVEPAVAKFLIGQAERIQRAHAGSILQTGKSLIEAKRQLSHGQFLRWVDFEVGMNARTAQAYMQVAQWAKSKSATVARLPPSLLYFLSSPSTPADFADAIIARSDMGERVHVNEARAELAKLRKGAGCGVARIDVAGPEQPSGNLAPIGGNNGVAIVDAVSILMRALSPMDFARVRRILTNKTVLASPRLREEIVLAFDLTGHDGLGPIAEPAAQHAA